MAKSKAAVEELDDDLELVDDDEADEAPKAKKSKSGKTKAAEKPAAKPAKAERESNILGAAWLAEHVNEELGTSYTAANMRVILRRMAADGDIEREVGTDRARYSFTGEKDPTVRQVLRRVKSGEATAAKAEQLEAATAPRKARKAKEAEVEEVEDVKPKARRSKAKAEPEPEPDRKPARRKRSE